MIDVFAYRGETNPNDVTAHDPTICYIVVLPNILILSYTRDRISAIIGVNSSHVVFQVDQNCDMWEARAEGIGSVGSGLLVGNGSRINANSDVAFDVDNTELTDGDKVYPIDVFAHNNAGWSSRQ